MFKLSVNKRSHEEYKATLSLQNISTFLHTMSWTHKRRSISQPSSAPSAFLSIAIIIKVNRDITPYHNKYLIWDDVERFIYELLEKISFDLREQSLVTASLIPLSVPTDLLDGVFCRSIDRWVADIVDRHIFLLHLLNLIDRKCRSSVATVEWWNWRNDISRFSTREISDSL